MGILCSFDCFVLNVYVRVNEVNALILFRMKITYIVVIQKYFILHRSGTAEEVSEKMELLREIAELMEAATEIIEAKRKEQQQKNKDAKKKLLLQKKGKDLRLHAIQALNGEC